jgi:predicted ATPase
MVRFGYPKAHEDDADRAVRCGLDMIKAVAALEVPNESNVGKARMLLEETIGRGNLLTHAPTRAFAQTFRMHLALFFYRDYADARNVADNILSLATEHDLQFFKVYGELHSNWLRVEAGDVAKGITGMHDALIAWQTMGYRVWLPRFLGMLASAYHRAGEAKEGLHVIRDALSAIETTSEREYEAEVLRIKGELLLIGNPPNGAEAQASFLEAIDVARHQNAKIWELRAATSLARLFRDTGRSAEAHDVLARAYGWFAEGLDVPDLKDARTLLDELKPSIGEAEAPS